MDFVTFIASEADMISFYFLALISFATVMGYRDDITLTNLYKFSLVITVLSFGILLINDFFSDGKANQLIVVGAIGAFVMQSVKSNKIKT